MRHVFIAGFLLASLFVAGCHENIIKLRLPDMEVTQVVEDSPLTIAVAAFQDQRPTPEHLGVYIDLGGEKEYFQLRNGSLSDVATQSFIQFLNQSGFSASDATDAETADIRIEAEIETPGRRYLSSLKVSSALRVYITFAPVSVWVNLNVMRICTPYKQRQVTANELKDSA